jgi:uncharacterized DUF497 family protein
LKFEWDERKNQLNIKKHNVSFEDAETVFQDSFAVYLEDEEHSRDEERFIIIGISETLDRELYVCYCLRGEDGEITRIISARKATKREIELYKEGVK